MDCFVFCAGGWLVACLFSLIVNCVLLIVLRWAVSWFAVCLCIVYCLWFCSFGWLFVIAVVCL